MTSTALAILVGLAGVAEAEDAQSIGEPGRVFGKPNPLKNVYSEKKRQRVLDLSWSLA